jgi:predicted negative regulator of RcsB-dependent stress response
MHNSAKANLTLAGLYFRKRDIQKAVYYLDKISDKSPFAAARKYELIGDMMMHQGQTEKVISACEKSLEINSG